MSSQISGRFCQLLPGLLQITAGGAGKEESGWYRLWPGRMGKKELDRIPRVLLFGFGRRRFPGRRLQGAELRRVSGDYDNGCFLPVCISSPFLVCSPIAPKARRFLIYSPFLEKFTDFIFFVIVNI